MCKWERIVAKNMNLQLIWIDNQICSLEPNYIHQGTWSGQARAILENISSMPIDSQSLRQMQEKQANRIYGCTKWVSLNMHIEKSSPTKVYVWTRLLENMCVEHLYFLIYIYDNFNEYYVCIKWIKWFKCQLICHKSLSPSLSLLSWFISFEHIDNTIYKIVLTM